MPNTGIRKIYRRDRVCVLTCSVHKQGNNYKIREKLWYQHVMKSAESSQYGKIQELRQLNTSYLF